MHHFPAPALLRTITVAILFGLATIAVAQTSPSLEAAAPRETILAVGLTPEPWPEGDLDEALDELDWERAGEAWSALAATLEELGGDLPGGAMALGMTDELPGPDRLRSELEAACPDLGADLDALHEEGWAEEALLTVSADAFSPFPAGLLAIRTASGASDAVDAVHERLVGCFGGEVAGEQDGTELHVLGDGSDLPLVLARADDLTLVGTRPDVVRGALRRLGGAEEPSFADAPIGAATAEMEGGVRLALHASALADVVESRLPTFGDEAGALARDRVVAALRTLGGVALRLDAVEDGLVSETALAFDPEGGDEALAELLACDGCRASAPDLVPADAFAANGTVWRAEAWFDYVDDLVRDLSGAAGMPTDLRTLLEEEAGVDVDAALFDWIGDEFQAVRLEPFSPDLRDLVLQPPGGFVMPVESAAAAEDGLEAFAGFAETLYGEFAATDPDLPDDLAALVSVREAEADGVPYRRVRIGPGDEYGVGLVGDRLVIASPASAFGAFVAVERGDAESAADAEGWARVTEAAEGRDLVGWSYGAGGGDLIGLADLVDTVAQPLAFLAATGLDAALEEARDGGSSFATPQDDPFGDPFGSSSGTTVDVATAVPSTTRDVAGIGATMLDVPVDVGGELSDATPEVGGDRMDLVRLGGLEAGTTYTIEMTSDAFDTYLYLFRASDGGVLASNDDAPSTRRSAITFTADGETALIVGASAWSGSSSGAYELRVSEEGATAADPAASGSPQNVGDLEGYGSANLGGAEPRALPVPIASSGELAGDDASVLGKRADLYRLEGLAAGDVVTVEMTSDPIDTFLYLVDGESERILAENDDAPFVDRSELRFTADGERDLLVAATSWSGNENGPYEIVVDVEPGADDAATPADPDAPATTPDVETPETDAPDEADEAAEEEAAPAPTFDELLVLFDVAEGTIRTIGERLEPSTSVTFVEDDVARTIARQAIDW